MSKIQILDSEIANKIAAGEVVERPASVIKELVENSIDAKSTAISIEITDGGITYMRVADDGTGMDEDDAATAFMRHATSKLKNADDLFSIATLGFRGEALASVAAVAHVTLKTHTQAAEYGTQVTANGGIIGALTPCGCPNGTSIEVADLFYNVPARLKFLKSARTEAGYISDFVSRMILARPDISFKLVSNGKMVYHSIGDARLTNAIYAVHGAEVMPYLKRVEYFDGYINIIGYVGTEQISRTTRQYQSLFVNGRYIRSQRLSQAIADAFDTRVMSGHFPFAVLSIGLAYGEVDVNVHPNKMEVRFKDEAHVTDAVTQAVARALGAAAAPSMFTKQPEENADKVSDAPAVSNAPEPDFAYSPATPNGAKKSFATEVASQPAAVNTDLEGNISLRFMPPVIVSEERGESHDGIDVKAEIPIIDAPKQKATEYEQTELDFGMSPFSVIGCAFDSFWFVQQDENVFIIDQHAAHERILYEGAMKGTLKSQTQMLLVPIVVKLSAPEYELYSENEDIFRELGFIIEGFGTFTVRIMGVPHVLGSTQDETFFMDSLSALMKNRSLTLKDAKRNAIITASCKGAVKLGMPLPHEVIVGLLKEYQENGAPMTCPHGRPVMVAITKKSLFKMFKRIV